MTRAALAGLALGCALAALGVALDLQELRDPDAVIVRRAPSWEVLPGWSWPAGPIVRARR